MFRREMEQLFYRLAAQTIEQGLLTPAERDKISRRRHRKHGNWTRHVRDLCSYIEYKQGKENHKYDAKGSRHPAATDTPPAPSKHGE